MTIFACLLFCYLINARIFKEFELIWDIFNFQQLKRDMDQLETWLSCREPILDDKNVGDSIDAVEELLRKHEDFEKTVFAQEDRFNAIKRKTLVWFSNR